MTELQDKENIMDTSINILKSALNSLETNIRFQTDQVAEFGYIDPELQSRISFWAYSIRKDSARGIRTTWKLN
jgi:hypothetical protein